MEWLHIGAKEHALWVYLEYLMGNENGESGDSRVMKNVQKTAKHEAKQGNDKSEAREKQRDSSPMQELMTKQKCISSRSTRPISVSTGSSVSSRRTSTPASHGTRFGGVFSESINGNVLPKRHLRTRGTTFGLLFSMRGAKEVKTHFSSTNTVDNAPANYQGQRYVHFTHHFSKELRRERLYVVVVIFCLRSYLVADTFDEDLPDENQAIKCFGVYWKLPRRPGHLLLQQQQTKRAPLWNALISLFTSGKEGYRDEALKGVIDRICFYTDGCMTLRDSNSRANLATEHPSPTLHPPIAHGSPLFGDFGSDDLLSETPRPLSMPQLIGYDSECDPLERTNILFAPSSREPSQSAPKETVVELTHNVDKSATIRVPTVLINAVIVYGLIVVIVHGEKILHDLFNAEAKSSIVIFTAYALFMGTIAYVYNAMIRSREVEPKLLIFLLPEKGVTLLLFIGSLLSTSASLCIFAWVNWPGDSNSCCIVYELPSFRPVICLL
ncbi:hypothetical protein BT96DRAFT_949844 [Gymnopus androsaceus JB14]|uniref:Uncharacterized protein n=1 Tax=Gymnopus androsaceus JB14 TaxID=1447944 RepID=A0A6A4GIV2_9AGAR|nr:hypothetical protein BT96DRAFT_949844 [Gymnopus androsaceus JB14]